MTNNFDDCGYFDVDYLIDDVMADNLRGALRETELYSDEALDQMDVFTLQALAEKLQLDI